MEKLKRVAAKAATVVLAAFAVIICAVCAVSVIKDAARICKKD